jgi:hypothetical protein
VTVRDLLDGHLPYLPELPGRGPGADMVGRATALLVDVHAELTPSGWRVADRPGRDRSRAEGFWRQDLDELAEAYEGWEDELKVQVVGPWTLAATLELQRGERVLVDPGAVRDVRASFTDGLLDRIREIESLVPGARLVVQVDEPALPSVIEGRLPTASGYGRVPAVDPQDVESGLREVVAALEDRSTVIHCCDGAVPLPLLRATGAGAVSLDTTGLTAMQWESVAATVEDGVALWAGCLPTDGSWTREAAVDALTTGWRRTGMSSSGVDGLTVTPACGLAGAQPPAARDLQRRAVDVASALTDVAHGS